MSKIAQIGEFHSRRWGEEIAEYRRSLFQPRNTLMAPKTVTALSHKDYRLDFKTGIPPKMRAEALHRWALDREEKQIEAMFR
jgi:hypothetical protein